MKTPFLKWLWGDHIFWVMHCTRGRKCFTLERNYMYGFVYLHISTCEFYEGGVCWWRWCGHWGVWSERMLSADCSLFQSEISWENWLLQTQCHCLSSISFYVWLLSVFLWKVCIGTLAALSGAVLVLHTPNINYIFEIYWGIICIAVGKNGKENMEGLKMVQLSTVIVTLLYSTLLDNLLVKGSILLGFLVFIAD